MTPTPMGLPELANFSFWLATAIMLASTVFFFVERNDVSGKWKTSLTVAGLVTGIAFWHYLRMSDMNAATDAGDEYGREEARGRVKALKKERKELKKAIAAKEAENSVDTAKIDEIKAKIKEAQARQNQAMMDDDDDAEEAAEVEMKALMKELEELTGGSIPKKKLEDAKSKDAQINK